MPWTGVELLPRHLPRRLRSAHIAGGGEHGHRGVCVASVGDDVLKEAPGFLIHGRGIEVVIWSGGHWRLRGGNGGGERKNPKRRKSAKEK